MDLLAVEGSAHAEPLLRSRRQDRAFDYGSAFSRAMSVAVGGREAVYVSGTASIDPQGRSVHLDEPEAQIIETLLSISALLEQRGAGLGDITLATVFCKHRRVACAYRELVELLGLPAFPAILVLADICRPELQVEIEAVAIVPARGRAAREVQP